MKFEISSMYLIPMQNHRVGNDINVLSQDKIEQAYRKNFSEEGKDAEVQYFCDFLKQKTSKDIAPVMFKIEFEKNKKSLSNTIKSLGFENAEELWAFWANETVKLYAEQNNVKNKSVILAPKVSSNINAIKNLKEIFGDNCEIIFNKDKGNELTDVEKTYLYDYLKRQSNHKKKIAELPSIDDKNAKIKEYLDGVIEANAQKMVKTEENFKKENINYTIKNWDRVAILVEANKMLKEEQAKIEEVNKNLANAKSIEL